ncbi:MAG TPA: NAD(P)H-dependent glycerol-3-phosphate dehydrogenase [Candidatus Limnocylindria bacterium]
MSDRLAVVGAGAWGTTLAIMLANAGRAVSLWAHTAAARDELNTQRENRRYLPGVPFPDGLDVAGADTDLAMAGSGVVLAVPSAHLRSTLRHLRERLDRTAPLLSVVKGIEADTHLRPSEVIAAELPEARVAALSGPNLAREIAAGKPAGSVVASEDEALAARFAEMLGSDRFRVYTNPDLVGVELAGALKNVIALAAGMADGLQLGDSAKAGIVTRGLAEMTRLGVAAGADQRTFAGLAGVGDLIATCTSALSRNRRAGELIGSGLPWTDASARIEGVAEGVTTVRGALSLAAAHGVELPIAEQVSAVLHEGRSPAAGVAALMGRVQKDELAGLRR